MALRTAIFIRKLDCEAITSKVKDYLLTVSPLSRPSRLRVFAGLGVGHVASLANFGGCAAGMVDQLRQLSDKQNCLIGGGFDFLNFDEAFCYGLVFVRRAFFMLRLDPTKTY